MAEPSTGLERKVAAPAVDATQAAGGLWQRVKEHKLVQTALAYFAAALALAHGEELVAKAYAWPELVGKILIAALALGLPVTLTVVWFSGRKLSAASRIAAGRTLDRLFLIILALLIVALVAERFLIRQGAEPGQMSQIFIIALGLLVVALLADRFLFSRHAKEAIAQAAPIQAVAAVASIAAVPMDDRVSLAVLPFVNMSSDSEQEYFSDGLSEELMNQLAQVRRLRVAARTSCFAFKGKNEDMRVVGEKLGVGHVLEGSVRKAGTRLRITAQLIDCADGSHLWSQTFDRELDDVFAIQENVARAVAEALGITLGVGEKVRAPGGTTSLEAYDKYLRARALASHYRTPADLIRAAEMYREALALDQDFAQARGSLAGHYATMLILIPESTEQTLKEMTETVKQALARAPDHWASHLADGVLQIQRHDWPQADAAFAKVKALAPASESDANYMSGVFYTAVGRSAQAVQILQAARSADPLNTSMSSSLQQYLDIAGRSDEAQAEFERTKDLEGSREPREHMALMRIWDTGDEARIKAQFRRFLDNEIVPLPVLAQVLDVFDQPAAARALIKGAFRDPAYQDPSRMMILAWYAAHYGDKELALAAMRRAFFDMKGIYVAAIWFPVLADVRKTQGFKDLVRDLGLVDYWRSTGKWSDHCHPLGADDFECR